MGQTESTNATPKKNDEEFFGLYETVPDKVPAIYRSGLDVNADRIEATEASANVNLGKMLEQMREARDRAKQKRGRGDGDSSSGSSSLLSESSSEDGEAVVGKRHGERVKREDDEEKKEVAQQELEVIIKGDAVVSDELTVMITDAVHGLLVSPAQEGVTIKWFLGVEIGGEDLFDVQPFASGVTCRVPINALGRYVCAIITYTVEHWTEKGYEVSVGGALDPLRPRDQRIHGEGLRRITTSASVGPVTMPQQYYMLWAREIQGEELVKPMTLDAVTARQNREDVALDEDDQSATVTAKISEEHNALSLTVEEATKPTLPVWMTAKFATSQTHVLLPLNRFYLRLVKAAQDESVSLLLVPEKRRANTEYLKLQSDKPIDLLVLWGTINCLQASWDERVYDPSADYTKLEWGHNLLQQWLQLNRARDLVPL